MSKTLKLAAVAACLAFGAGTASAQTACDAPADVCQRVTAFLTSNVKPWASDPTLVNAVTTQNTASANLSAADIQKLDASWTSKSDQNLVNSKTNNDLATFLKSKKAAGNGVINDILVFDNKGLNVGQTDMTTDYNQGDEAKYSKTFSVGPDAIFIDKIVQEGGKNALQANMAIKNASNQAIGAMTVGINTDTLK